MDEKAMADLIAASEQERDSSDAEEKGDESDDNLGADLDLIRELNIDMYQQRIDVSDSAKKSFNDYFEISNVANETEMQKNICALCGQPEMMAIAKVPKGQFPGLTLFSHTCPECGASKMQLRVDEESTTHTGRKLTLKISSLADLALDIVKTETATVEVPEVGLEVQPYSLGNMYTTVGGMLHAFIADMSNSAVRVTGESGAMEKFFEDCQDLLIVKKPYTVIIDDPRGSVYLGNCKASDVLVEEYEDRSTIPEHNLPTDYENTEEYAEAASRKLGLSIALASYPDAGRGVYATKSFKAGDLIGHMYGRFSTDFEYSDRIVQMQQLTYRFKTKVFLDGASYCPVTFINDPSFGKPKLDGVVPNCLLKLRDACSCDASQSNYLCVYALVDIEASTDKPVELWMEYRPESELPPDEEKNM